MLPDIAIHHGEGLTRTRCTDQQRTTERIDNIQEEIDEQNANLHTKTKQLNDIKSNIQSFEDNITTSSSQITENDKQVDSFKNQIQKLEEKRLDLQSTLAQITEDIVKTLDEKLKDAGFSENALKKAKDELETKINKLKIFVEGRKNIFGDMISQNLASQDYKDAVCQAEKAFEDAFNQLNEIQLAISEYQNASPAFITEFLSPQGIMTKKRDIDEQINQNIQSVESINSQISHLHGENKTLLSKIEEYKETLNKLKLNEIQMKEQISASQSQINMLNRQISSEKASLEETENELFIETKRADEISDQINTYQDELAEIEYRGKKLAEEMNALDSEIAKANKNVSGKSDSLNKKREEQNRCQEQYERLTISINSSDNDIRNVKQNF